jgi:hypothetical protein
MAGEGHPRRILDSMRGGAVWGRGGVTARFVTLIRIPPRSPPHSRPSAKA